MSKEHREKTRKQAEVMLAYADGKEIQRYDIGEDEWEDDPQPLWNWAGCYYRVKPQAVVFYTNIYERPDGTLESCGNYSTYGLAQLDRNTHLLIDGDVACSSHMKFVRTERIQLEV